MNGAALDRVFRAASGRIVGALAVRFRDLDLAEDAFSDACARALRTWPADGGPANPTAWLYRVAERVALDALRQRRTRERLTLDAPPPEPTVEEAMMADDYVIPDERLRLIFICCHPAVASDARAALTLRLVCGLTVTEIARAFLLAEPTLAQRLVRAKRKIADAGVPFELPRFELWPERMEAVLSTLEVAYAKAHEDGGGSGPHARFGADVLQLTRLLAELVPSSAGAHALAATVRYAEARRPARVDDKGIMLPLSEQSPARWRRDLIDEADAFLDCAVGLAPDAPRVLQAALHCTWCARRSLADPAPWFRVLLLYDRLLAVRDDPVVRLNRLVAVAEVLGPEVAFAELAALDATRLATFPPYQAVRAELCASTGRTVEARAAYEALLALGPAPAERAWLSRKLAVLPV